MSTAQSFSSKNAFFDQSTEDEKPSKKRTGSTAHRLTTPFLCPQCKRHFSYGNFGGLYGLHPTEFDDIFITVLCDNCTDIVTADPSDSRRLSLKSNLEQYFRNPIGHPFHEAVAITSLKILEIHGGDLRRALEIGWPLPKAMHHYHVVSMFDGDIVMVSEKETHDE